MSLDGRRVLVHGTGSIGMRHARLLRGIAGVELALLPVQKGRIDVLSADGFLALDLARAELFSPDLVIVSTDTRRHVADALHWLERGVWTLVEKPVSTDASSLSPLTSHTRMRVACVLRAHPILRELRKQLPRVGAIHSVRIEAQSYLPDWRPGRDYRQSYSADPSQGGVLRDLVHELDYASWIFGRPRSVQAWLHYDPILEIAAETSADLTWPLEEGGRLTMRLDYVTRTPRRKIVVDGREGTLMADLHGRRWQLQLADSTVEEGVSEAPYDAMYQAQIEAMLSLSAGGEDPIPLPGYHEAREVMELMDTVRRSSESDRALVLPGHP